MEMMISLKEMGKSEKGSYFLIEELDLRHINSYLYINGVFIVYIENSYLIDRKGWSFLDLDICVYIILLSG